jgi:hypothetical protein
MIHSRKLKHWIGTRGHEYFKKDGIYRNKLFMPTRYLYENLKYEIVNFNRNDASCKQDLTDLSDDFLDFLDIDKLPLNEGEFPNFLHWSIQNLRKSRSKPGNYSYKRAYAKSFNCYSELEHGEEKETAMDVMLNPRLLHSEILVYGHTKKQGPPYMARIAAHKGFREFVNMSFFISDKQVTSAEDANGLLDNHNFPYQRKKLLRVSPEKDSFVIGTVFWDSKDGVQRTKETWKSLDNFYRENQLYHVYVGEIDHIGGD